LASLFACYAIATQSLILGSTEGGWAYGYLAIFSPRTLMVAAAATAISAGLLFGARAGAARRDWPLGLAWIALGLGLQALIRSVTPFSVERMFISDGANAFYGEDISGPGCPWGFRSSARSGHCMRKQHAGQG
jgi:hypothetical protein